MRHTTKSTNQVHQKTAHAWLRSMAMGPHGGAAKTAHHKERSIVPQELHLKALSCYVDLPPQLLLPTNASKRNCLDG